MVGILSGTADAEGGVGKWWPESGVWTCGRVGWVGGWLGVGTVDCDSWRMRLIAAVVIDGAILGVGSKE